jgi:hypothetical protein
MALVINGASSTSRQRLVEFIAMGKPHGTVEYAIRLENAGLIRTSRN